ncbi:peroxisomal and mitochondrial division factor 1 [Gossypium hirsutum]|nr:peroxisomal and mitochondrial division factor 1 [Gossypium hirsutum]
MTSEGETGMQASKEKKMTRRSDENEAKLKELSKKLEALQKEKLELRNENKEVKETIEKLTLEIDEFRHREVERKTETDQWEDEMVLESLASRSAELENEVSRLQHDLITSMSEIDEANKDAVELKRGLEEKAWVIEGMEKEISELKKEKLEIEKRERDLERKLGVLEVRETEERSKKVRLEEEMKEKVDELKKNANALQAEVARTKAELDKTNAEIVEFEERAKLLESNMLQVKERVEGKTSGAIKGRSKVKGWLLEVPAVAILFAAAVVFLCSRQRS